MGKSKLTLEIEEKLEKRARANCERFAFEVPIKGGGIVDMATAKTSRKNHHIPYITCYEIKVSLSDFKSKNGHNFYGDENYYVLTEELYNEIIKKDLNGKFYGVGVIVYKNGKLYTKSDGKHIWRPYNAMTFEEKMRFLDQMLMKWINSGGGRF